jgi:hypothetical protein
MSGAKFHHYNWDEFLAEFYPDPSDKQAIASGMEQLRAEQRAFRLAEMRRRLGISRWLLFGWIAWFADQTGREERADHREG